MNFINQVAFITGAAQGLGKAFTEALLKKGARVCFTDIQGEKGQKVESDFKGKYGQKNVLFLTCDVSSSQNLKNCFQRAVSTFGGVDIMVNNAGIVDEENWKNVININLVGALEGSMLAIEHMRTDKGGKGGKIINIASTAGLTGVFFTPSYSAAKFGLVGFHRSWASNPYIGQLGLQFGCLCPAFTDTAILYPKSKSQYDDDFKKFIGQYGVNKVETVVEAFLMLVESENCNQDIITVTAQDGIQYHYKENLKKSNL
ncbi:15-hydroxyprostaglandin dehydrogenase [NAD(+)] [Biomphalaria glabrata]|nr:15-hydroxyprostaglandin dehydrogenase [NAD(+)] [Biomphalaria glabrata]